MRSTEVKPMIVVATYSCDLCGGETYQPVFILIILDMIFFKTRHLIIIILLGKFIDFQAFGILPKCRMFYKQTW